MTHKVSFSFVVDSQHMYKSQRDEGKMICTLNLNTYLFADLTEDIKTKY